MIKSILFWIIWLLVIFVAVAVISSRMTFSQVPEPKPITTEKVVYLYGQCNLQLQESREYIQELINKINALDKELQEFKESKPSQE